MVAGGRKQRGRPRAAEVTWGGLASAPAPQLCQPSRSATPQRPNRLNHPTPTDNISSRPAAHLRRSRCVPTTILSAVRRSTPERCVPSPLSTSGGETEFEIRRHHTTHAKTDPPSSPHRIRYFHSAEIKMDRFIDVGFSKL